MALASSRVLMPAATRMFSVLLKRIDRVVADPAEEATATGCRIPGW